MREINDHRRHWGDKPRVATSNSLLFSTDAIDASSCCVAIGFVSRSSRNFCTLYFDLPRTVHVTASCPTTHHAWKPVVGRLNHRDRQPKVTALRPCHEEGIVLHPTSAVIAYIPWTKLYISPRAAIPYWVRHRSVLWCASTKPESPSSAPFSFLLECSLNFFTTSAAFRSTTCHLLLIQLLSRRAVFPLLIQMALVTAVPQSNSRV